MRVPPDQSSTRSAARASARSGSRPASSRVIRVSRVPKAKASTRALGGDAGLHVLQQHARVGRHRARDVADEHEPARALGRLAVAALDQLAAVAQRGAHRRAQVVLVAAPARGARAAAEPLRAAPRDAREQLPGHGALGVGVLGEVLLAQQLHVAARGGHRLTLGVGSGLGAARRHADARQRGPRSRRGRRAGRAPAAPARRRRRRTPREDVQVRARGAQRGAQREVGVLARAGVDGRERAVGAEQLADADAHAAAARAQLGRRGRATPLRHH